MPELQSFLPLSKRSPVAEQLVQSFLICSANSYKIQIELKDGARLTQQVMEFQTNYKSRYMEETKVWLNREIFKN